MSESPKVVTIRSGVEVLPPGEPRPKLIAMLEDLLERARSGDICGAAIAFKFSDETHGFQYSGAWGDGLMGAVERMKAGMVRDA